MKNIGVLYGEQDRFLTTLVERMNARAISGLTAEPLLLDKVILGAAIGYAVMVDGVSSAVPFYRTYLKSAALAGTAVMNNPFGDDGGFLAAGIAAQLGIAVPRMALLPSRLLPEGTRDETFRNLAFPLDWRAIFDYVGFPAVMKPARDGARMTPCRVHEPGEFFERQAATGTEVMVLQQEITGGRRYRCCCVGQAHARLLAGREEEAAVEAKEAFVLSHIRRLSAYLGSDFLLAEFTADEEGKLYLTGCSNLLRSTVTGQLEAADFEWLADSAADYVIQRALGWREGADNLTWGLYTIRAAGHQGFGRWAGPPEVSPVLKSPQGVLSGE